MIKLIYSQWLRTKRMPIRIFLLICPIAFTLIFCSYLSIGNVLKGVEVFSFFGLFNIVATFGISFFVPMLYDADKDACYYTNDLRVGVDRKLIFFSKFFLMLLFVLIIEIIAIFLFITFLMIFTSVHIRLTPFLIYFLLINVSLCPMIVCYQFISLKYNYTGSILIGCFTTLASILLGTTGLGAIIWKYLPFVWSIKLALDYGKGQIDTEVIILYFSLSILLTLVLLFVTTQWYNKWEGINYLEE
ncbi:hypothetical protein [Streptococcus parauberis]|uniref:hypothetical protein n=1 Tax=Streptococcus parauberis TaxID=1348 RepID=UPI000E305E0D|nr:hypothetical protein [Streptococcus parauberis]RFE01444.1 ABC-2 family transporter protein [Streptococcus parauberis]